MLNRFREADAIDLPVHTIGEGNPVGTLIGGIVDSLLDVLVLERKADRFNFYQQREFTVQLDREIAIRAANHMFGGDLRELVVAEELVQEIRHDHHGVRLVDVARLC